MILRRIIKVFTSPRFSAFVMRNRLVLNRWRLSPSATGSL